MNKFWDILRRFIPNYKKEAIGVFFFGGLSTVLSLFSFALFVPILEILFKTRNDVYQLVSLDVPATELFGALKNNLYYYVTEFIIAHGQVKALIVLSLVLVLFTFLKVITYYFSSLCIAYFQTGVLRDVRDQLTSNILHLPIGFFSEERKGDIMSRMSNDVMDIDASIMGSLEMLVKNPLIISIYFVVLALVSWELTLFVLIMLPFAGYIMGAVGKNLKKESLEVGIEQGALTSQLEESLGGMRIIKAFNAEGKIMARFKNQTNRIRNAVLKVISRQYLAHPMSEFIGTSIIASVICYGGYLILNSNGQFEASVFIYYILIFYSIINPVKELSRAGYNIRKGLASLERIDKILNAENPIQEPANPVPTKAFTDAITYKNVSFKYSNTWILQDINLTIPKGKTVAIVGQSGSGKSTLVDLLPRFYDVNQGEILIDGVNVKDMSLHNLRELMGNVNQEAILFNDSFFNNIAFGVENATMEQVIAAAKIANAHDFISATEQGYHSNIGDRGCKLSGGQRQRISIARAILKNPPILILDEATSALDTESEKLVQEALENLMRNRTTIVIAHRLSTVQNADEICVMDQGRIVERGTHNELLQIENGIYKKLQQSQALK
jgi:ABC-type multidrug transport system fused ATPase/permease subunit